MNICFLKLVYLGLSKLIDHMNLHNHKASSCLLLKSHGHQTFLGNPLDISK